MRIGIDCRSVIDLADGELAGVGYYTYSLVHAMVERFPEETFVLFVNHAVQPAESVYNLHTKPNVEVVPVTEGRQIPFWTSHVQLARKIREAKCDVFHAPAYVSPFSLTGVPQVVTIHDLAIYQHPEWFASQSPLSKKILVPRSIQKADAVIAVSHATAEQVSEIFPSAAEKTHVVYEAAVFPEILMHEIEETMRGLRHYHGIHEQFFFFVGTIEPRKNLVRVVHAFEAAMKQVQTQNTKANVQLILAGGLGWKYDDVTEAIQESGLKPGEIKWIDYVSQTEKVALIAHSEALVIASLDEGFGLPAVEAMQLGTPVIASRTGALPEVTGGHAVMVDPYDEGSLRDAFIRVLNAPEEMKQMAADAVEYAKQMTWERAAEETMLIYKQLSS